MYRKLQRPYRVYNKHGKSYIIYKNKKIILHKKLIKPIKKKSYIITKKRKSRDIKNILK